MPKRGYSLAKPEFPPFGNGSYKHCDSHDCTDNVALSSYTQPYSYLTENPLNQSNDDSHDGQTTTVDLAAIRQAVRTILRAVGEDPDRPGLLETPRRVASMYAEMFRGLHLDPARHLATVFPETYDEMVLVRDITFTSMCEHHLLPFSGVAHVAYIPNGKVTGLSKLARVVEEVAARPQVQERMTQQIAELIEQHLHTTGVAVVISAEHSCMSIRGVRKPGSRTVTSALRGIFKDSQSTRAEFMSLISD